MQPPELRWFKNLSVAYDITIAVIKFAQTVSTSAHHAREQATRDAMHEASHAD